MENFIEIKINNELVTAKINILKGFSDCIESVKSPFGNGQTFLSPNLNIDLFEEVVIKCLIQENDREKILRSGKQPQSVCREIIESFQENNWPNKNAVLHKLLTCNPYESQYLYLIEK